MNLNQLNHRFEAAAYNKIETDMQKLSIYYRASLMERSDGSVIEGRSSAYVVLAWDFLATQNITDAVYRSVIDKIKWNFLNKGFSDVELLNLLCTYEPENLKEFCGDYDTHWIFCMDTGQIIIFENQVNDFPEVRALLETKSGTMDLKKIPAVTIGLISVNIIIYLLTEITGSSTDSSHMMKWGAMFWPYVMDMGQVFRLFTYMFLHFGIEHLINNMFVYAFTGSILERTMGHVRYLVLYLGSGILAGAASMIYNMMQGNEVVGAGASGAIFGVTGAMTFIILVNKGRLENLRIGSMIIFLVLTLYNGFASKGVDNAAHIGGFLAGFVLAVILYRKPNKKNKKEGGD